MEFVEQLAQMTNVVNSDMLMVLAAYGIVQTLAQDMEIKTADKQRSFTHWMPMQVLLMFSAAFAATSNRRQALLATVMYYGLKYVYGQSNLNLF